MSRRTATVFAVLLAVLLADMQPVSARPRKHRQGEVYLGNEEYKKLDRFEAHALDKADEAYNERDYRRAGAEYETFLREYPRSIAIPYVLLRKARCLHLDDKRHVAIRQYNEVLDYFPNAVEYAAPAIYYQGLAHWENGDEDKAMRTWAKMARDKEYRKHPLAAGAINKLADNLAAKNHLETAVEYFRQVAVDFYGKNHDARNVARAKVTEYYIRTAPSEPKFRAFCADARLLFGGRKVDVEKLAGNRGYWHYVLRLVHRYGRFEDDEAELKTNYYRYWADALDDRLAEDDHFRLAVARLHRLADGDAEAWVRRLEQQFRAGDQKDYGRIVAWIAAWGTHKEKAAEYYKKLDFARMSNEDIARLVRALFDSVRDPELAANAFRKLDLAKMPDDKKVEFARYLWHRNVELGVELCMSMKDKDRGRHEILTYYHGKRDAEQGLPLADHLIGVPEYAKSALWKKAELLEWSKKHKEAIKVYQQYPDPPSNLWRIASCYEHLGLLERAVAQLREVEGFFKDHSAQAAIRIAHAYRRAKLKDKAIAAYRRVLVKYPDTNESSDAHDTLERMGVKRIRGGVKDGKEE